MATKMTREEAIKIVQSATVWTDEERDALAMLIPELAESEDERIRKWLCDYFSSIDGAWIHKDITCIDILRWLEKQKEQKQEKFPPYVTGFKGDPDPAGTSDLEEAAKEYASKTLCDPDDGPSTGLAKESFIAGAEWQKEQKPLPPFDDLTPEDKMNHPLYLEGFDMGREVQKVFDEQKPAEWSEEDEKDMAHIIRILDDCYVYGTHDLSKTDHENLVNKLKSLRPQYHGDVTMTEAYKMGKEAGEASSWKPSEEQMEALNEIVNILAASPFLHQNDYLFNILNGLREELKKLL